MARTGSSPLARGLRAGRPRDAGTAGIIPARAGFTDVNERLSMVNAGSSPLARGLPVPPKSVPAENRIIPARAGFTGQ